MNTPLVSVLITVYNRELYLADAIKSALNSSYRHIELIIVDDGSNDRSVEIARDFASRDNRVRLFINEKNLGDYHNRNKAASYASGKYIKYLDADDMIYDYGLEVMVRFTEQFPEAGFGLLSVPDDDKPFPVLLTPREIYLESFRRTNHFDRAPGSGLIKLDAFNAVGGFSGKRMIGDYEFWFKISRYFSMVKLPMDLYWNRLHNGQESQSEYARKNYSILREQIFLENINHPDCPLQKNEIVEIKKRVRRAEFKENLLSGLSKVSRMLKV